MFTETEYAALLMRLAELGEEKFRAFNEKLMPGTTGTYGVRIPLLRTMAKEIIKNDAKGFLAVAQDDTHEERMLQGLVIAGMRCPEAVPWHFHPEDRQLGGVRCDLRQPQERCKEP